MTQPGRIEALFSRALAISDEDGNAGARREFVRSAAEDDVEFDMVMTLLRVHASSGDFLADGDDAHADAGAHDIETRDPGDRIGQTIGRYRLESIAGEGGFAVVYRARNTEVDASAVALKLLKPGLDSRAVLARFSAEQRVLARLEHEGITRITDAGQSADGLPWFAMDFVNGLPITDFADMRRLSIDQRLVLFRRVCAAIQHAHQKGIIHRDLKPSNVLTADDDGNGEPIPKIIDFGIAKAAHADDPALTRSVAGTIFGTPQYMSPEQAAGNPDAIDVRSDIYSLGIILFELLTGSTPRQSDTLRSAGSAGLYEAIRSSEIPRPSSRVESWTVPGTDSNVNPFRLRGTDQRRLVRQLRGDLDLIVRTATRTEPGERYASVSEFAEDIRRVQQEEPILARRPSAGYLIRRFVARHRAAVIAASLVVATLCVAVVGMSIANLRLSAAQDDLIATNNRLHDVTRFQSERLAELSPEVFGGTIRRELDTLAADPEMESRLEQLNFTTLARNVLSHELMQPTEDAIRREFDADPITRGQLLQSHASLLSNFGLYDDAAEPQTEALALRRDHHPADSDEYVESVMAHANLLVKRQDFDAASSLLTTALAEFEGARGTLDDPSAYRMKGRLASFGIPQGRTAEILPDLEAAAAGLRRTLGDTHSITMQTRGNLATAYMEAQRFDDAIALYDELRPHYPRERERDRRRWIAAEMNRSLAFARAGKLTESDDALRETLAHARSMLGDQHPITAQVMNTAGLVRNAIGKREEAADLLWESARVQRATYGSDHQQSILAATNAGVNFVQLGDPGRGLQLCRAAFESSNRVREKIDPRVIATATLNYGFAMASNDESRAGLVHVDEAWNILRARPIPDPSMLQQCVTTAIEILGGVESDDTFDPQRSRWTARQDEVTAMQTKAVTP